MKTRYRIYRRNRGVFYLVDKLTRKRESLETTDPEEATRLLNAKNESTKTPAINLQIARAYLMAADPLFATRTWQHVMQEAGKTKTGSTKQRWTRAMKEEPFDIIRHRKITETQAEHILATLQAGTVSTNVFLRRLHNFALDLQWLPAALLPKHQWPAVKHAEKRAVTIEEHQRIVAREKNPERRAFYECCWHLGGSQGDIASLEAEDIDWPARTIAFRRKKTKTPVVISFGEDLADVLRSRPNEGLLFPSLAKVQAKDRGNEFRQRCRLLGITGITLHSYRYSWAERAKTAGMPERFAQQALGHGSKAVARAYAKKALVRVPSLEDYENKIISLPKAQSA